MPSLWRIIYFAKGTREIAVAHSVPRLQKLSATKVGAPAVVWLPRSVGAACRWHICKNPWVPRLSRRDSNNLECLPGFIIPGDQQAPDSRARAVISHDSTLNRCGHSGQSARAGRQKHELPESTPLLTLTTSRLKDTKSGFRQSWQSECSGLHDWNSDPC
jgi:hypothetical protein